MARLIDADELISQLKGIHYYLRDSEAAEVAARILVAESPTIDAVEVVRCKDCVRFVENKSAFVTYCSKGNGMTWVRPDDFCSHAERITTND